MQLPRKKRIRIIQHIPHSEAFVSTYKVSPNSIPVVCSDKKYFITDPPILHKRDDNLYLMPILMEADGTPWHLANQYLFSLATGDFSDIEQLDAKGRSRRSRGENGYGNTRDIRRKAAMLLDYKMFCEGMTDRYSNPAPIDLFNFMQRLPSKRPTWLYFSHLQHNLTLRPTELNARTGVVYQFYKFASQQQGVNIDMDRVDSLTNFSFYIQNEIGLSRQVNVTRRGQTLPLSNKKKQSEIGFVREDGEQLRPLQDHELTALLKALRTSAFLADEILIHYLALDTGERKQTILTLRKSHINELNETNLTINRDAYRLEIDPRSGCDTKFNKLHHLIIPISLSERLKIWWNSSVAKKRRKKFAERFGDILNDNDMYVFLSPAGDCRYMSKLDPRYRKTMNPAMGQVTRNLKTKLMTIAGDEIPPNFTFHWLRATFALRLHRRCQKLVADGKLSTGMEINIVRRRMHHEHQETTENYLKLFSTVDERLRAQEIYEDSLLGIITLEENI